MQVKFSYLDRQFANVDDYLADVKQLVLSGDFTLGAAVTEFERRFAEFCQMPYAVGVNSGTDALILSMEICGVGPGDEVIVPTNTFIASVGAIAMAGATPVFVDNDAGFVINPDLIEAAITPRTKAILAVHLTGNVADMPRIMEIAKKHNLLVFEDACQSITGARDGKSVGSWGETVGFSLHPLKNLNVWGDGGIIVTRSQEIYEKLRLYRNHGLINRDEVEIFGHNSRLDSLQAVIGNRLIDQTEFITNTRIANAKRLDEGLADLAEFIEIPPRLPNVRHVYHLYIVRAQKRDELLTYLQHNGVEAKVHYPIPVHLQKASAHLGYKKGDFPVAEKDAQVMITLPAHQHLRADEIDYMIEMVRSFYGK
jgi:aminotransferase EvaB